VIGTEVAKIDLPRGAGVYEALLALAERCIGFAHNLANRCFG